MTKCFVFDLDGVIRHWDPAIVRDAEARNGLPAGELLGTAFEPELLLSVITGEISDAAWRSRTTEILAAKYPDSQPAQAVADWSGPVGEVIVGAREAIDSVRSVGKVALLTNATDRLRPDLEALGLIDSFDHIFNSSEIGYAKPDPRVFAHVEQTLEATPADVVFIDDSATNVAAAASRGWDALFATPETRLSELLSPYLD